MAAGQVHRMMHQMRRLAHGCAERACSDGQLLERFVHAQDEHAFAELLRRHGPMVLGVCRRLLGHAQDAEDAFQATFLVLVRKARSVMPRELVGNWLHGVACRVALDAQARSSRRRAREKQVQDMPHPTMPPADLEPDLRPLLDRELSGLPEKYRVPIVLCDLEGRTRKDVARRLGVPEGTLSSRLNAGRKLLAGRLARRGLAVSGASLATALAAGPTPAAVPESLAVSTIKAAALGAAGPTVALGLVSAHAAALTEGVMKAMLISKLKTMAGLILMIGLITWGTGVLTLTADEPVGQRKPTAAAVGQGRPVPQVDNDELWLQQLPDGGFLMLQSPPPGAAPQPSKEQPMEKAVLEQWLHGQLAPGGTNEAQATDDWTQALNEIHRNTKKWTALCVLCHQQQAGGPLKEPRPKALSHKRDGGGDIIVIRLPKTSTPEGDAQFLRRLCLDVLGRTPTPLEMRYFLADKDANKYRAVVQQLAGQPAAEPQRAIFDNEPPKQLTPAARAEAYVRENLGKQQLSPAERQIVERVVEFMQKQPK